jgi:IS30 family transposase
MVDATAATAVEAFSEALNRTPGTLRKSMTYDQGKEMAHHKAVTERTGVKIYLGLFRRICG